MFRLERIKRPVNAITILLIIIVLSAFIYFMWSRDEVLVDESFLLTKYDHERQYTFPLTEGDEVVIVIELTGDPIDFEVRDVNSKVLIKFEDVLYKTYYWNVNQTGDYTFWVSTKWVRATVKFRVAIKGG